MVKNVISNIVWAVTPVLLYVAFTTSLSWVSGDPFKSNYFMGVIAIILFGSIKLIMLFHGGAELSAFHGGRRISVKDLLILVVLVCLIYPFSAVLPGVLTDLGFSSSLQELSKELPNLSVGLVSGYVLLVAPLVEELLVRGFFQKFLSDVFTPLVAAIVSAVVFTALHVNVSRMVFVAPLAIILSAVFMRYQSVLFNFVLHALFNSMGFLWSWLNGIITARPLFILVGTLSTVILLVVSVYCFIGLYKVSQR